MVQLSSEWNNKENQDDNLELMEVNMAKGIDPRKFETNCSI